MRYRSLQYNAQAIVRDGEGATKFITINVEKGVSLDECAKVAHAIARSPLVKTAFLHLIQILVGYLQLLVTQE